jgi:hypothetical protein
MEAGVLSFKVRLLVRKAAPRRILPSEESGRIESLTHCEGILQEKKIEIC